MILRAAFLAALVGCASPPASDPGRTRYRHAQKGFRADRPALPLAYGRIGEYALVLMFSDPRVKPFVVNAGGHLAFSCVQNPAWDFSWTLEDYPLHEPVGFEGRILYTRFESNDQILRRYYGWLEQRKRRESQ